MSVPTPTELPLLQGRYRIEERLGSSRLAVVYRAYDERLQRAVLVHLLRRELAGQEALRTRFVQEAQLGAGRSHRSLMDVYDTGDLGGRPFLITEYIAGRPLRELGALAPEDALLYFRQVVGAVAACQAAGVPHPPISSANILLVGEGHVELVESWLTPAEDVPRDLACYRPPERTAGAPLTPAGAVYSLGILLAELLSGRRPIDGADASAVARAHMGATIPSIAELQPRVHAPSLERILQAATAADPQDRLSDAAALARAVDSMRAGLDQETGRIPVLEQAPARQRAAQREAAPARRPDGARARPAQRELPTPDDRQAGQVAAPPSGRALLGLALMGGLLLVVVCGALSVASSLSARVGAFQLPSAELPLSGLGLSLPEWLTGVAEGQGEVLVVSIPDTEGLNLRAAPGLGAQAQVITLLPNGTRLRRLDGPQVVDEIPWLKVRVRVDGRDVEGWVSARYVRPQ